MLISGSKKLGNNTNCFFKVVLEGYRRCPDKFATMHSCTPSNNCMAISRFYILLIDYWRQVYYWYIAKNIQLCKLPDMSWIICEDLNELLRIFRACSLDPAPSNGMKIFRFFSKCHLPFNKKNCRWSFWITTRARACPHVENSISGSDGYQMVPLGVLFRALLFWVYILNILKKWMQLVMICHHGLIQKSIHLGSAFCIFQMNPGRAKRNSIAHFCKQNITSTINRSHLIHSLILFCNIQSWRRQVYLLQVPHLLIWHITLFITGEQSINPSIKEL